MTAPEEKTKSWQELFAESSEVDQTLMIEEAILIGETERAQTMCLGAKSPESALKATLTLVESDRVDEIEAFIKTSKDPKTMAGRCAPEKTCFEMAAEMDRTDPVKPKRMDTLLDLKSKLSVKRNTSGPEIG